MEHAKNMTIKDIQDIIAKYNQKLDEQAAYGECSNEKQTVILKEIESFRTIAKAVLRSSDIKTHV